MADEPGISSLPLPVAPGSNSPMPNTPLHSLPRPVTAIMSGGCILAGSGVQDPSAPCSRLLSGGLLGAGVEGLGSWSCPMTVLPALLREPGLPPPPPQLPLSPLTTPGRLQCCHGDLVTWWAWGAWLPAHSVTWSFLETPGGHDASDCSSAGNPRKTCCQTSAREEISGNRGEHFP